MSDDFRIRPAELRSLEVGRTKVTFLPDGCGQLSSERWFPNPEHHRHDELDDFRDRDGHLISSIGAILLQRDEKNLLIDSGLGPGKDYGRFRKDSAIVSISGGSLERSLSAAAVGRADISRIAISHAHFDHIGWISHVIDGSPYFDKSTIYMSDAEWRAFISRYDQAVVDRISASVQMVGPGDQISPGLRAISLPGHSDGHIGFDFIDGGTRVFFFGDALHSPVQIPHPDWEVGYDLDPARAVATRRYVIRQLLQPNTIGVGCHFPGSVFGRAFRHNGSVRWFPMTDL